MDIHKAETKRLLAELGRHAETVAEDDRDKREAIAAERESRAELVTAVIAAVRVALPALSAPIPMDSLRSTHYGSRGLHVGWDKGVKGRSYPPGPVVDAGRADPRRGRYAGTDLFLTNGGDLVELTYDGPWSMVTGEVCSWEAVAAPVSIEQVVVSNDVVARFLDSIQVALIAQADGDNRKVARRAGELAQRLHAIAVLVRAA